MGILLKTRFALDQYINLRPVKLYPNVETPLKDKGPEHIDFVVVRENSGGIYTGIGGVTQKGTPLEVATQVMQYSRPVVERCVKYAYEYTRRRNSKKKMLTLVSIVRTSAIFPSPNRIRKTADNRSYVNYTHLHVQPISLCPGENKPTFVGVPAGA